ncbi:MAG: Rho-binding antiterminator [Plesiomonas sp.]|uniref:Rho-binding antiterminator n=1 Tax=Plesiomonas sp. TaxID=2486279 RepID=UPI003F2E1114
MKAYQPISCAIYDLLELACMHHYRLHITQKSGDVIEGKALDMQVKNQQEFIVVQLSDGYEMTLRLDTLHSVSHERFGVQFLE